MPLSPGPVETTPPVRPSLHGTTDSGGPSGGASRGTGNDITCSASGNLKGHPGALQGHQPKAEAKERPHAQPERRRAARTAGRSLPRRGEGAARKTQPGKASAESVRCVTETTGRDHQPRSGRVPHPSPPRHTPPPSGGEGARGERPAGRARRAVPFAKECPSLVWRGLGPARESATSPHRSSGGATKRKRRAEGDDGETRHRQPLGTGPGGRAL